MEENIKVSLGTEGSNTISHTHSCQHSSHGHSRHSSHGHSRHHSSRHSRHRRRLSIRRTMKKQNGFIRHKIKRFFRKNRRNRNALQRNPNNAERRIKMLWITGTIVLMLILIPFVTWITNRMSTIPVQP